MNQPSTNSFGIALPRAPWVARRTGDATPTQLFYARQGVVTEEMRFIARPRAHRPRVDPRRRSPAGAPSFRPTSATPSSSRWSSASAFKTKINANIGNSAVTSAIEEEVEKLHWAVHWGADTVMDLSTGKDIHATREAIVAPLDGADRHGADLPGAREGRRARSRSSRSSIFMETLERAVRAGRRLLHHPRRRAA